MTFIRAAFLALLAAFGTAHGADGKAGAPAKRADDPAASFAALRAAAEAGDERAFAPLAMRYAQGAGTPRDFRAAEGWARKSAAKNRADGQFALYAILVSRPELNYIDAQGRIDAARYAALAKRPITEREDEMTAYDSLGRAAAQGHPEAMLSLAGFYADNVGEGNRRRAGETIDRMRGRPKLFDDLRARLGELDALGPTLLTVRLADDALAAVRKTALAAAAEKDKSKADCAAVKPLKVQRMGPVVRPIWLPLVVEEMKSAYLMSGDWRERWTVDVCGAETFVQVQFTADGLGGATFTAQQER